MPKHRRQAESHSGTQETPLRILGVDPGTIRCGWGIIEASHSDPNGYILIAYGTILLEKITDGMHAKLSALYAGLDEVIKRYSPRQCSIETAFYGKNVQSALKIGYARGAAMLVAAHNSLEVYEYSPREIKKAVVGSGAASKQQVGYMVGSLMGVAAEKFRYDESDAVATALCHAYRNRTVTSGKTDWQTFIKNNPGRVIG